MSKDTDQFSPEETRKRFEAALRGARVTGHKSMSDVRDGMPKRNRKKSTKRSAAKRK